MMVEMKAGKPLEFIFPSRSVLRVAFLFIRSILVLPITGAFSIFWHLLPELPNLPLVNPPANQVLRC